MGNTDAMRNTLFGKPEKIKSGIVVDCSCTGGNPGTVECRGLDLSTGEIVFDEMIGLATNNIGEWLAIAYGANYITEKKIKVPLFSDSKICINWYNKQQAKTNIFRDYPHIASQNKNLIPLLEEAQQIIELCRVEIKWWDKYLYGENPADYGRK